MLISVKSYSQCTASYTYVVDSIQGKIQFSNTSTLLNIDSVVEYNWILQPGTVLSNVKNPIVNIESGLQNICLTITNAGCSNTYCDSIQMPERYCLADFKYTSDIDGVTNFQSKSLGSHVNHYWSFGDGEYSIFPNPTHQFSQNGWYYVCLNIVNSDSTCTDLKCEFLRINKTSQSPCEANFEYTYDALDTKKVTFSNSTLSDSTISFAWLFGDGDTSTIENPTHLFKTIGNYQVCLLLSGPNCSDSICKIIEVLLVLPECKANFSTLFFADSMNNTKRIALFSNLSIGENMQFLWDFGDDSTAITNSPIHYYANIGVYKVCLTAYNGSLCTDSFCSIVEIKPDTLTGLSIYKELQQLLIYPIPAKDFLTIEWVSQTKNQIQLGFRNILGEMLIDKTYNTSVGLNKVQLDLSQYEQGAYFIEISYEGERKVYRILK